MHEINLDYIYIYIIYIYIYIYIYTHTHINTVSNRNTTYRVSITKGDRVMQFRKITALSSDSPTEQAKLYGQNSEFFNVNTRVLSIVSLSTAPGTRCPGGWRFSMR